MPFDGSPSLTEDQRTLFRAADLIRHSGLAKCVREDREGRMCLHGALHMAISGIDPHVFEAESYDIEMRLAGTVVSYLRKTFHYSPSGGCEHDAATWNNQPERTTDEVIDALEATAREMAYAV